MGAYAERLFWAHVDIRGEDECWPWKDYVEESGYGRVSYNGKVELAHRVAFVLSGGQFTDGPLVLHSCDNPPCCNPKHLHSGTHAKNNEECVLRGRHGGGRVGGKLGRTCKLSERQRAVLAAHAGCAPMSALAALFGVSESHAYLIVRRTK